MNLKDIQKKLKTLRDRIKDEGSISASSEAELRSILNDTLITANDELLAIQDKLNTQLSLRAGNDNVLSDEQKKRLRIIEKTGTGSYAVH
jgi:hypothetical protein